MKTHNHVRRGNPWRPTTMYVMAHSLMLLGVFKILQLIHTLLKTFVYLDFFLWMNVNLFAIDKLQSPEIVTIKEMRR